VVGFLFFESDLSLELMLAKRLTHAS